MTTIALSFIVKDETNLAIDMINSVAGMIDFISFVDTGSTDTEFEKLNKFISTLNIQHKSARIEFNGFDTARNLSLDLVPDDIEWIIVLDADEVFTDFDVKQIKEILKNRNAWDGWYLPRYNWADKIGGQIAQPYPDPQLRFFKNNKNYRFIGDIHEVITGGSWCHDLFSSEDALKEAPFIHHVKLFKKNIEEIDSRQKLYCSFYKKAALKNKKHLIESLKTPEVKLHQIGSSIINSDAPEYSPDRTPLSDSIKLLNPRVIIELGAWDGVNSIYMANKMLELGFNGTVIAVDTWLGSSDRWLQDEGFSNSVFHDGCLTHYRRFMENINSSGVAEYIMPMPLDFLSAAEIFKSKCISPDIIYIEAHNDYSGASSILKAWWPLLRDGGVIIFNCDFLSSEKATNFKSAVDDFFAPNIVNHANNQFLVKK